MDGEEDLSDFILCLIESSDPEECKLPECRKFEDDEENSAADFSVDDLLRGPSEEVLERISEELEEPVHEVTYEFSTYGSTQKEETSKGTTYTGFFALPYVKTMQRIVNDLVMLPNITNAHMRPTVLPDWNIPLVLPWELIYRARDIRSFLPADSGILWEKEYGTA